MQQWDDLKSPAWRFRAAVLAIVASGVATVALAGDFAPDGRALPLALYADLGARPTSCSADPLAINHGVASEIACFELDLKQREFARKLRAFADRHPSGEATARWLEPTRRDGKYKLHKVQLGARLYALAYDDGSGRLQVEPLSCATEDTATRAVHPYTEGLTPPQPIHKPRTEFPERARVARIGGAVVLEGIVGRDGSVSGVCVLHEYPTGHDFADAAARAFEQWRFQPGKFGGRPAESRHTTVIDFTLR